MSSNSKTITDTFSESKAKYVMGKINDDFIAIANRGFDCLKPTSKWLQELKEDLYFIMVNKDLEFFQIQFKHSSGNRAIEYKVKSDGSIHADNESGRIDYWIIPRDAIIYIVVRRYGDEKVGAELQKNGWTENGSMIQGNTTNAGAYSKDGYGATKKLIGTWE